MIRPATGKGVSPVRSLDQQLTWSASFAAASLFVPLCVPLLSGRVFTLDDLLAFHLPLRFLYGSALARGDSVLWSPMLFGGFFLHAEGQVGVLHPLHLFLYRVFPLAIAFNLELIFSYAFAFAGMWFFLRRAGLKAASRIVGATAFAFSGFNLLHICHMNGVAIAAHIPWLLLACDVALSDSRRSRSGALAAISLLTASQVLLGYPQYVWMSALTSAVFAIVRAPQVSRLWPLAVAGIAGIMVGGVQLIPTADLLGQSARAIVPSAFPLSLSLHPLNLLQLWSPYVFPVRVYAVQDELFVHELGVYNGALCTIAIVWAIWRYRQLPCRRTAVFAGVVGFVGLVLALGRYGLVYRLLTILPVLSKFRAPARYLLLVHLALAILAAIMVEDLSRCERRNNVRRHWLWIPFTLSAATAGLAWLRPDLLTAIPGQEAVTGIVLYGGFLVAAVSLLVADAAQGSPAALVLLPLALAFDLGIWGYSYVWWSTPQTIPEIAAMASVPPSAATGTSVHSTIDERNLNLMLMRGLKVLRPYVGLAPMHPSTWPSSTNLRLAGVEWISSLAGWSPVQRPMARVRVVPEARVSTDPAHESNEIDIERTALTDRALPALARPEEVNVSVLVDRPGRMELQVSCPKPALLSITETYHSGWKAQAGDRSLLTVKLYGEHLGILLEPGQYRAVLLFAPQSLQVGTYVSAIGLLLTGLLAALTRFSRVAKRAHNVAEESAHEK